MIRSLGVSPSGEIGPPARALVIQQLLKAKAASESKADVETMVEFEPPLRVQGRELKNGGLQVKQLYEGLEQQLSSVLDGSDAREDVYYCEPEVCKGILGCLHLAFLISC